MKNTKIAITGAAGLVGSHIAEYLAKKGYQIKAITRSAKSAESFIEDWSKLNIALAQADINDEKALEKALSDTDLVIHAAGIVDPYASPEQIDKINVKGSQQVLETAIKSGLKQCIFISSLSVITGNKDQYNTNETAPLVLCGESYADSKVKAEQIVTDFAYANKIGVTVLRPGFIYGARERAWMPQLIQAISSGRAILVDNGKKETNVIYVENLNKAIEASILNEKSYGQIYNLTDGQCITKKQLCDAISDNFDLPRVSKNLPSWLIKPIFDLMSSVISGMPLEKRKKLSRFSKAAYRLIGINQGFSIKKAEAELNYTNLIPFEIGIAETLAHFKKQSTDNKKTALSNETKNFIIDYCQRHSHPVNALWHILGVPLAFFGLYKLITGSFVTGMFCLFFGYLFQYLGHKTQGNEVGEVTLIKKCYALITQKSRNKIDDTAQD